MSKKALKKNAAYWRGRFTALEDKRYRKTAEYYDKVKRIFSHAEAEAKDKLAAWYNRLAINNEISYADAFKLLKADELEEFHWTVQEYIDRGKNVGLDPKWEKQLENASAKVHVSRLEEIQTELKATVENLYSEYETGTAAHLSSIANDSYYHTAYEVAKGTGIGTTLHRLDSRTLTKLLTTPWGKDEEDFSDRIWQRRDKLIQTLNDELAHNLILGLDPQKSIDKIAEDFEVDKRAAGRLVMTESAAIGSMAREASLKELEVEEFEIVATLDSHTSTICQQMDGQHFPMSKFKVGTTAPPFHPNCRSTTVPYFNDEFTADETRAARDANDKGYERVPSDMTYKEWKKRFVTHGNNDSGLKEPKANDTISVKEEPLHSGLFSNLASTEDIEGNAGIKQLAEQVLENLGIDRNSIPVNVADIKFNGLCDIDLNAPHIKKICHYSSFNLRKDDPRPMEYRIKTVFHESYHVSLDGRKWDAFDWKGEYSLDWHDIEETLAESSAHYLTEQYGITKKLAPSYPKQIVLNLPRLKMLDKFKTCETIQDFGRIAYEERRAGKGGAWKKLSKQMQKVMLADDYYAQYFEYIQENEDKLLEMYFENYPGLGILKKEVVQELHDGIDLVRKGGTLPETEGIFYAVLACAMQVIGVK